jgi:hypothetical protein
MNTDLKGLRRGRHLPESAGNIVADDRTYFPEFKASLGGASFMGDDAVRRPLLARPPTRLGGLNGALSGTSLLH